MPDILPPQLVGAQQRPLYVKVRTALTVISSVWLIAAITGLGFFSGGTTSLALSLMLLYGTGAALIVVIAAVYRVVKKSALKRAETTPEDSAAGVFVDTARSATEELRAALRPPAATGSPQSATGAQQTAIGGPQAAPARTMAPAPSTAPGFSTQQDSAARNFPAKPAVKPAPNETASSNAAAGKPAVSKPAAGNTAPAGKPVSKPAPGPATGSKKPQATTSPAAASPAKKGRPDNSNGSKQPATRTGSSGNRTPAKKQSGVTDGPSAAGPAASVQACSPSVRPSLVLASSSALPQLPTVQYVPDSRQRAS